MRAMAAPDMKMPSSVDHTRTQLHFGTGLVRGEMTDDYGVIEAMGHVLSGRGKATR